LSDTDRLNNLVESILLATKIDDRSLFLHKSTLNLSQLIQDTALQLMESNTKKLDFEFLLEPDLKFIGDENAMVSITTNLVSNAIKYSPDNSNITITLMKKESHVLFSVTDQGAGVPLEERNKIFNKFYRIGDENTRKQQGTGLGLFLVKYLVEQHNGSVSVQNNSPKGAIFACKFNTIT
jgi:two-component system phosphate regulon sensor histidine kinase PhoR